MVNDLVSYQDVLTCRRYFPNGWIDHHSAYTMHFSYALNRRLTQEETNEILSRMNGYGPHRFEETFAALERNSESFWRNP